MIMRKLLFILLFLNYSLNSFSQSVTSNWYFGKKAGLNFSSLNPQVLTDGNMATPAGCATISDNQGNLLFYTNGQIVWNKDHLLMENDDGIILGNSNSTQSSIIIPIPGSDTEYYIFTLGKQVIVPLQIQKRGLYVTKVDLSFNGGLGKVTVNSLELLNHFPSEKITAVHHSNGRDIWVITNGKENDEDEHFNKFWAFKVTDSSIDPPILSHSPTTFHEGTKGQLKVSPDGTKLAMASLLAPLNLLDFDATTGDISNNKILFSSPVFGETLEIYGVEFSRNSKYLYTNASGLGYTKIYQYDLAINNPAHQFTLISFNEDTQYGSLQLASNGNIYRPQTETDDIGTQYVSIIHNADNHGDEVVYEHNAIDLGEEKESILGLPNFVQSFFRTRITTEKGCVDYTTLFEFDTFSQVIAAQWDFGNGDMSNDINPNYAFTTRGAHVVSVLLTLNNGQQVSASKEIMIYDLPSLIANQELEQCDDDTDGLSTFNLYNIQEKITDVTLDEELIFYRTSNDAIQDTNRIDTPEVYENTVPNQEIFVRVINENGCFDTTSFFIRANFVAMGFISDIYACENIESTNPTPEGVFDLRVKMNDIRADLNIPQSTALTFYESLVDAQTTTNPLELYYTSISKTIWIRGEEADQSCSGIQSFNLIVNPKPAINLNESYTICDIPSQHPPVVVSADASNDRSEWLDSNGQIISTQLNFTLTTVGTYTLVSYKTENGILCENRETFTVIKPDPPTFGTIEVNEDQNRFEVSVNVLGNSSYQFSIDGTNYFGNGVSYTFTNVTPGLRTIYVRDVNSCEPSIQIDVPVIGFPKFFTPNNDGINDTWNVKGVSDFFYKSLFIRIYDRYGKAMYQINSFDQPGWNGTYNGKKLIPNDYWFSALIIDINDRVIEKKGNISLIRTE